MEQAGRIGYTREISRRTGCDVLVCGGGPAGFSAALAAARAGMKVLLVESKHQLGGMGTTGLVSHWLGGRSNDGRWVVGGIFRELSLGAAEQGIAVIPNPEEYAGVPFAPYGMYKGQLLAGIPFDPFLMAPYLESVLLDAGVEILYEAAVVDAERDGDRICRVITAAKDGLSAVEAQAVVDATGDADVAAAAGCGFDYGDAEGVPMAVSLMIHLENVRQEALMDYVISQDDPRFRKKMARLREEGVDCYNYEIIIFVKMTRTGYFMINGRALPGPYGTDPVSRTRAYITERAKIRGTLELFRSHWPGCRDATLRAVASGLGVRETRRIKAEKHLSVRDILAGLPENGTVGFTAYGWDINRGSGDVDPKTLEKPPLIPIPYGVMVPEGISNLICPGRSIDCQRVVLGPMRVQAPIMAMGQAAGTAAAMAVSGGTPFREIAVDSLRTRLSDTGAVIEV